MMKKIVLSTDFTEQSQPITEYAIELAMEFELGVQLVFVIDVNYYTPDYRPMGGMQVIQPDIAKLEEFALEEFKKLGNRVKEDYNNPPQVDLVTRVGNTGSTLVEMSKKDFTEFIMLNSDHHTGFFESFFTDTEDDLIYRAECPVWFVPPEYVYKSFNRIVYTTDYREADIDAIKKVVPLARKTNAFLFVLHVTDDMDFNDKTKEEGFQQMLREETKYQLLEVETIPGKNVEDIINRFANKMNVDAIALLKRDRSFIKELFVRGSTKKVILKAERPVIVFHEH
ncbi:MAG: universal stress protein [Bacteroidota bacterium]